MRQLALIYSVGLCATAASGIWMARRLSTGKNPPAHQFAAAVATFTWISILALQFCKLFALRNYVDFAAWVEIIANIARGKGPWCSIQEGFVPGAGHWFSTHFTPLVYLFALPFKLFPYPGTLLVAQSVALGLAPIFLYAYALDRLGERKAAFFCAAAFAIHPAFLYVQLYEFEMLRFCIPTIILTLWAWRRGWRGLYWAALLTSMLMREEVAIPFIVFGLALAFSERSCRKFGALTTAVSVAYFLLVTQAVMPAFRNAAEYHHVAAGFFSNYGTGPVEIAVYLISHPILVLRGIFDPIKMANLIMLLAPFGFLPLLAPVSVAAVGNFGLNMLSTSATHTSYFLYYIAPSLAFFAVGAADALPLLLKFIQSRFKSALDINGLAAALFVTAFTSAVFFSPAPYSIQFWMPSYRLAPFRTQRFFFRDYTSLSRLNSARKAAEGLQDGALVSAEQSLLPVLAGRASMLVFPEVRNADYVFIDKANPIKTGVGTVPGSWDGLRQNPEKYYLPIESSPAWNLETDISGVRLYRRVAIEVGMTGKRFAPK